MNQVLRNPSSPQRASGSQSSERQTTVLVVDDHPAIREALSGALAREEGVRVLDLLSTAAEVETFLNTKTPDVFVVDISLGDGGGLDLIEKVRAQAPETKILVYSMHDESLYAGRALRAGALGYVPKSASTDTVIEAIQHIKEGEVYLSPQVASQILGSVIRTQKYGANPAEQLTERELTVFRMLGRGESVREIADQLDLSRKTVETYRRRAKEKFGYETVDELLRFAIEWRERQGPELKE
jgi:DNA-binding NarL/FixJ family response regulator